MSSPMISVVMPTYNSEKYVAEAVESILAQTYSDFEFLIVNEFGVEDNTVEICNSYKDSRIRIIQNIENIGIAASLNEGIRQSAGKYIARMDADDISLPERFEKQIKFMESNEDIAICGTWASAFGNRKTLFKPYCSFKHLKAVLLMSTPIIHPSVMMRESSVMEHSLWYDTEHFGGRVSEDYRFFSYAAQKVKIYNIPEILLKYRVHGNNATLSRTEAEAEATIDTTIRNLKHIGIETDCYNRNIFQNIFPVFTSIDDVFSAQKLLEAIKERNRVLKIYDQDALQYVLNAHYSDWFSPRIGQNDLMKNVSEIIVENALKLKTDEFCLFGLGEYGQKFIPCFIDCFDNKIKCVSDNNIDNKGKSFFGLPYICPNELSKNISIIVIANYLNTIDIINGLQREGFINVIPFLQPVF